MKLYERENLTESQYGFISTKDTLQGLSTIKGPRTFVKVQILFDHNTMNYNYEFEKNIWADDTTPPFEYEIGFSPRFEDAENAFLWCFAFSHQWLW